MPHIHTQPGQHDHTASGFIIRIDTPEPTLMLHMHRKMGRYMQFGGHIELDETPWQAVKHELLEESGYTLTELQLLQPTQRILSLSNSALHPYPVSYATYPITTDHFHTDVNYAFVAAAPPQGTISEDEATDQILVTRQQLAALSDEETFANIREIGLFIFDECLPSWERVDTSTFQA